MRKLIACFMVLALAGCYKTELEGLDNNPFDADYAGAMMFSLGSDTVVLVQQPNGGFNRRFIQRVRVHSENFLIPNPTYVVAAVNQNDGSTASIFSNQVANGLLELTTENTTSGTNYCWEVRLTNQGGIGARNTVCSVAD